MRYLKKVLSLIKPKTQQQRIEEYLSQSTDLVDLERRQRQLTYGINPNLKGWV